VQHGGTARRQRRTEASALALTVQAFGFIDTRHRQAHRGSLSRHASQAGKKR